MSEEKNNHTVEVGLDWITCVSDNEKGTKQLANLFNAHSMKAESEGGMSQFRMYSGYEGFEINGVFCGLRGEKSMLIVKSGQALEWCSRIDWENCHPTRIDLQVTSWRDYREDWAQIQRDKASAHRKNAKTGKSARPLLIRGDEGEGDTLQMGSRDSPRFGRMYDKGLQSEDPFYAKSWRYEVEYKGDAVSKILTRLRSSKFNLETILSLVAGQFDVWGIQRTFHTDTAISPDKLGRKRSDVDAKLKWLDSQVRPTLDKLRAAGVELEALQALGLIEKASQE